MLNDVLHYNLFKGGVLGLLKSDFFLQNDELQYKFFRQALVSVT